MMAIAIAMFFRIHNTMTNRMKVNAVIAYAKYAHCFSRLVDWDVMRLGRASELTVMLYPVLLSKRLSYR